MQDLYELNYSRKYGPHKLWEFLKRTLEKGYRYDELRRTLLREGLITQQEAKRIENFGTLRDRVVHRLVKYSFQTYKEYVIRKDEVIQGLEEGLTLVDLLSAKSRHRVSMTVGGTLEGGERWTELKPP